MLTYNRQIDPWKFTENSEFNLYLQEVFIQQKQCVIQCGEMQHLIHKASKTSYQNEMEI